MPTPYIQKLHKQGKGSIAELEHKWDVAKKAAKDEGREDDYAYIMGIFKHAAKASTIKIEAAARLKATE